MKQYSSLPLRAAEDVIEEFGVSRKYTYLLIGAGLITIVLGWLAYLSRVSFAASFSGGASVLAPLLVAALWLGLIALGLYIGGVGLYLEFAYKYFLTNQRVIETVGLFAQQTGSTEYRQINDITVRQDFINRLLLGTGTIGISTPGTSVVEYHLINVDHPKQRAELVRDLIRSTSNDHNVDKYLIAHLMVKNGLMPTEQDALDRLDESVGKDPTAEATFGVISPEFQKHNEEFHSDGDLEAPIAEPPAVTESNVKDQMSNVSSSVQSALSDQSVQLVSDSKVTEAQVIPQTAPLVQNPVTDTAALETVAPETTVAPEPEAAQPASSALVEDADVDDLLGDGIDESDRLRAAQKRLQNDQQ